jgi:hypothetical protein
MTVALTIAFIAVFLALFVVVRYRVQSIRNSAHGRARFLGAPVFSSLSAIIFAGVAVLAARSHGAPLPWALLAAVMAICAIYLLVKSRQEDRH